MYSGINQHDRCKTNKENFAIQDTNRAEAHLCESVRQIVVQNESNCHIIAHLLVFGHYSRSIYLQWARCVRSCAHPHAK